MEVARQAGILLGAVWLSVAGAPGAPAIQGVRVVDSVDVSVAQDEAAHSLAGEEATLGEASGRRWRSAARWFSYSLRIYDDSPLTLVVSLADGGGAPESFDILVDGRKAATYVRGPGESRAAEVRVGLPFAETAGRTTVVVKFEAHAGSRTARVLEVRSVQEHLE